MLELILMALRSLWRNPLRTGLTMLGLMIGVAAFIAMVSFGHGARASVLGQFQKLGVNMLSVRRASATPGTRPPQNLTMRDVEALQAEQGFIQFVAPIFSHTPLLSYQGRRQVAKMRVTTPDFVQIHDWPVLRGGMFNPGDFDRAARVCVLGATAADALFESQDPVGEVIQVDGKMPCRVIGVLTAKGTATSGRDLDNVALIPATTYFRHIVGLNAPFFWSIDIRPQPGVSRAAATTVITDTLRFTHNLRPTDPNDFSLRSNDDAIQVAGDVSKILTRLLAGIAAVSLLVGGIGIMNIQLVAVAERTQEIGVRAAIGAAPSQILRQFLFEAVVLSLLGTLLGALIGSGISLGMAYAMKWPITVPAEALLGAVVFGASVGVFFGYLPARRAAQLDPITALRRE